MEGDRHRSEASSVFVLRFDPAGSLVVSNTELSGNVARLCSHRNSGAGRGGAGCQKCERACANG